MRPNYIPCCLDSFAVRLHEANQTFRPFFTCIVIFWVHMLLSCSLELQWNEIAMICFENVAAFNWILPIVTLSEWNAVFHFNSCFKKLSEQEFFSACAHLTLLSRVLMDSALCGLRNVFPNNCLGMPSCCRDDSRWDYNTLTSSPPPLSFSFSFSPFLNTFHCSQIFFPMFCQHRWSNNRAISLLLLLWKITASPFILWNGSLDIYFTQILLK